MKIFSFIGGLLALGVAISAAAQETHGPAPFDDKFRQLEEILPTPSATRAASGAPGHGYWQQRADYVIRAALDVEKRRLSATARITYANHSPDDLRYLWLQLDQNRFAKHSDDVLSDTKASVTRMPFNALREELARRDFEGGYDIIAVRAENGESLAYTINRTMMRVDLKKPLSPGDSVVFTIDWAYNIVDAQAVGARGGTETLKDGATIYGIAQWFPRMAAYGDITGWNHKQYLGRGEFTLEFGDYEVEITVPADHVVAATGVLANPEDVLSQDQRDRLQEAASAKKPVFIVTPQEAASARKAAQGKATKTWRFKAENVRDFAIASSRAFIWDARGFDQPGDGRRIMAMSFYPDEGEPLWSQYSTKAIVHALEVYSRFSFPYPYPTAQAVSGPVSGGMEYPMISFNGPGRVEIDAKTGKRSYGRQAKYGLISVVIHEVGHNYFPMIVNSDERQWVWMDEGLNSFLQFLAEQEWEENYPSRRGMPEKIVPFMKSADQTPIMTNAESLHPFGNTAYGKVAVALNILRETILGRPLFDFAFQEYARRWMFKRPYPADFFRTLEDASGTDLDWFWRGWFYTTEAVDIAIDRVTLATIDTENPDIEEPRKRKEKADAPATLTELRNRGIARRVDRDPALKDFYNAHDEFTVTDETRRKYQNMLKDLESWEAELLANGANLYFIEFSNRGGLVMPIILRIDYAKGRPEEIRIPAEIWRQNPKQAIKLLVSAREITAITVDPHGETADTDTSNNLWPRRPQPARLELFKEKKPRNLMQEMGEEKAPQN
ncbi:MAG: M1 family aminopeptidase [Pseudomonadota bacterium]